MNSALPPGTQDTEARVYGQPTDAEIQSGMDRQRWAENLILQLPDSHNGRNSWLLNYGRREEAQAMRKQRGLALHPESQAVNPPAAFPLNPRTILLRHLLERCRTVLGNMALENEGAWFFRWSISHEPLRNDAKHLVPLIDEALS